MKRYLIMLIIFCVSTPLMAVIYELNVDYTPNGSPLSSAPWVNPEGVYAAGNGMEAFRVDGAGVGTGFYEAPVPAPAGLAYTLTAVVRLNTWDWGGSSALGTDGFYENGSQYLTVSNAPAGTWQFATYHGQEWGAATYDILVDGVLTVDEHVTGTGDAPSEALFSIVSNGVDDIIIEIAAGSTGNGYTFINGFSTDLVPEPATMALLGLGGLLLRRRK